MNINDLKAYKAKLAKLDKLEKKQRNVYLSEIAKGNVQGPMVGYASVDKPWLKYMTKENIMKDIIPKNIYQDLYDSNKDYPNQIALMYFGAKITFKKFFENIDKTAKALIANGVKKGDYVTIYSCSCPEVLYTFYALAKLGAVAHFMDPFALKKADEKISECNVKLAIVLDKFYDSTKDVIKNSSVEKTVILPTLNSSPIGLFAKTVKPDKTKNEVSWNQFFKEGKNVELPDEIPYEPEMPVCSVCSSGSTGIPKSILLTHDSFEYSVHAYPLIDVPIYRNDMCYQVVPPWASTGISSSVHMPLVQGGTLYMDPRFERKVFVKNNLKINPAATIASTSLFQAFLDDSIAPKKGDLSNYRNCFQGGEKVEMEDKLAVEAAFKKYGSDAKLMNGYGQCECGAGICTQTQYTPSNVTVGIPIPGVTLSICDEDKNEVPTNSRGEILVNTPCGMKEYLNNPEATANYFYYDENGIKWNCTGDMGFVNDNGELTVLGRMNDYSMVNDEKIYNFDIETSIRENSFVQNVDVFTDNSGVVAAHVILDPNYQIDNYGDLIRRLQTKIYNDYNSINYVPCKFKFRDSFPAAVSSKRDVAAMKAETEGFIYSDNSFLLEHNNNNDNEPKKLVRII